MPTGSSVSVRSGVSPASGRGSNSPLSVIASACASGPTVKTTVRPACSVSRCRAHASRSNRRFAKVAAGSVTVAPYAVCWMPASSQPDVPSTGLVRFHTSSMPFAAASPSSRMRPV